MGLLAEGMTIGDGLAMCGYCISAAAVLIVFIVCMTRSM